MNIRQFDVLLAFDTFLITGLLAINYTLVAYGAAIIIGGSILGLALYFVASSVKRRTGYTNYGHHYANARMSPHVFDDFDILGLLTTALKIYQELNEDLEN